jgi:hypothetical protein
MKRNKHYSPALSRFLVSVLYHEAKRQKMPMTKLTDHLLRQALTGTEGWHTAESLRVAEEQPLCRPMAR